MTVIACFLTSASLSVSAAAWSVVYSYTIWGAIELAILMVVRDYLIVGGGTAGLALAAR